MTFTPVRRSSCALTAIFLLAALSCLVAVGCVQTVTPKLDSPADPVPVEQLKKEGELRKKPWNPEPITVATFSVSPEKLSALIIRTAEQKGWLAEKTVGKALGSWAVRIENHQGQPQPHSKPDKRVIFIDETHTGGSEVKLCEELTCLPFELYEPLRANVQTYLAGRPLTKEEKQQIALGSTSLREKDIIVTAGPLSQPYEALGEVHADSSGVLPLGELLTDTLQYGMFGTTSGRSSMPSVHTETMDRLLREEAIRLYGGKVDAVVNVVYRTNPNGRVDASGLAVRFVEPEPTLAPSPARSAEGRLRELKGLLDKGLITREEYEHKRAEILGEL